MKVVDREGRLFGRINLVDAAIGAFVVLLIPLGYAAVLLFRPSAPRITSIEPAPITMTEERAAQGSELSGKIKVRGEGLRPVLRAEIGGRPVIGFIFENPASADVLFGDLPAGTHDLVLFDGRQEVARVPRAVTIPEKPSAGTVRVRVAGVYMDLSEAAARALKAGATFPDQGETEMEVLAVGEPEPASFSIGGISEVSVPGRWQRSALVAVRCQVPVFQVRECRTGGALIGTGAVLAAPGSPSLRLMIEEVLPDALPEPAELRVRFIGYAGAIDRIRVGDRDREHWSIDGRGATVAALGASRRLMGDLAVGLAQEGGGVSADVRITDNVVALDAVLRLGLDRSRASWRYRNDPVRVGSPMTFTTRTYTVRGVVLDVQPRLMRENHSKTGGSR